MTPGYLQLLLFIATLISSVIGNTDFYEDQLEEEARDYEFLDRLDALRKYLWGSGVNRRAVNDEFENWQGRWMPDRPGEPTPSSKIYPNTALNQDHRVIMGQPSSDCDDAKSNLTVDWDYLPVNYTCYDTRIVPDKRLSPKLYCETIPKYYVAMHKCMNEKIEYDNDLPLYGTHRPLWPVYGEYKFLPKQRWLHSLEHGAIVMLYHPCANPLEVKRLKDLVRKCLWRHVISPYNLMNEDRPLALLSWGCKLTMSYVNPTIVTKFISKYALHGPENISRDGDFKDNLLSPAKLVSDAVDSGLCPEYVE